jgi:hypothetical protein
VASLVRRWGGAVFVGAMTSPAAAESLPDPTNHSTDLGSLIELRDDYFKSGPSMTNALVLRGDYAPERWISLRVEVPLVYADKPRMRPAMGVGDVYVRGTARLVASDVSLLAGSDLVLDTAASAALGGGRNVVGPFATVGWDLGPGVWVRLQLQQFASIGGDPKRAPVSATSVRPYALITLPDGYWMMLDQTLRFDHRGPRDFSYVGIVEGGKELSKEVSVYIDPGVQLDSPFALTWLMTAGVRWVMP